MSRVLIVEDDPGIRPLISMLLLGEGFEVESASNGRDGLDRIASTDGRQFSAIILDLEMPVMDGRTFYQRLRQIDETVPVLVLSAYGAEAARIDLGAEDALTKPFDPDVLLERVSRLVAGSISSELGTSPHAIVRIPGPHRSGARDPVVASIEDSWW